MTPDVRRHSGGHYCLALVAPPSADRTPAAARPPIHRRPCPHGPACAGHAGRLSHRDDVRPSGVQDLHGLRFRRAYAPPAQALPGSRTSSRAPAVQLALSTCPPVARRRSTPPYRPALRASATGRASRASPASISIPPGHRGLSSRRLLCTMTVSALHDRVNRSQNRTATRQPQIALPPRRVVPR